LISLTKNILTTLGARIGVLAISLISSVILARVLGPEGRGLFALVLIVPGLVRAVALLGFEQANAVYAGLKPEGRQALVWHSVVLAIVGGGFIAIAGIVFFKLGAPGMPGLVHGPLWLYMLPLSVVPACLVAEYWGALLRGMNRIALINVVEVGTKVASLALVVAFVGWLRFGVAGAVSADVVMNVAGVLVMALLLKRVDIWGKPSFDRDLWKRTWRFAIPAHGGTIAAYINYRVDEIIIAALLPPEQLGFYVLAVGIAERLWILTGSVGNALLPHLTNSRGHDPAVSAAIARHVMIWTGSACLLLFIFANLIVDLLYSSEFTAVVAPLRWLLPGIFALSIGKILVAELLARAKPYYSLWSTGLAVLVNVVLNLILVPRMGISGAAIASTVSYSLLSLMVTWCYFLETGVAWTKLVPCRDDFFTYTEVWHRFFMSACWGKTGTAENKAVNK
jgi:O-antigen/teichoic acid export membrane protein